MKTIEITIYKFEELSSEAQENAINKWRESETEYYFASDNEASLKAFTDIFPIRVRDFSYDAYSHSERTVYTGEADHQTLTGARLVAHIYNNYGSVLFPAKTYTLKSGKKRKSKIFVDLEMVMTGYYMDNVLLDPIYDFLKNGGKYTDWEDLLSDCVYQWGKACQADCHYQQTAEYIKETIIANEYDFTSEGELY